MAKKGRPTLPDYQTLEAMGFERSGEDLYHENIKRVLRVNDEQVHCNRFKWYNLPRGITGNMIERMLYYKGQIAWFYIEPEDRFIMLPFCLNGNIDFLGRYIYITPLPFTGKNDLSTLEDAKKSNDPRAVVLSDIKAKVLYDPIDFDDLKPEDITGSAVILSDYTRQLPQMILPKYKLTEAIIDMESKLLPYCNTALSNATGIAGMKIEDSSEQANVELASAQAQYAALTGRKWIPIEGGTIEFQELVGGQVAKAEEFLLTMQSMEAFRLGIHGVDAGGLFQKKAHMLETEAQMNSGVSSLVLDDALWNRQNFCDIVNSVTGFGIWCEPAEVVIGMDADMNGSIQADGSDQMVDTSMTGTSEGGENNGD